MKRIIAIAGAGALLLSVVTPAFAFNMRPMPQQSSDTNNFAIVDNTAVAKSSTGGNLQTGGSNYLITGIAVSDSTAVVIANTNVTNCKTCHSTGDVNNMAFIDNKSIAKSDTGGNLQVAAVGRCFHGSNWAITGDAGSTANAWTVVNTNLSF